MSVALVGSLVGGVGGGLVGGPVGGDAGGLVGGDVGGLVGVSCARKFILSPRTRSTSCAYRKTKGGIVQDRAHTLEPKIPESGLFDAPSWREARKGAK
jgi:hypothetical protein